MGTSKFNDGKKSLVGLLSRPGGMHSCRHLQTHKYNMAYLAKQVRISSGGVRGLGQCRFQGFFTHGYNLSILMLDNSDAVESPLVPLVDTLIDPPLASWLTLNRYLTSRSTVDQLIFNQCR